MAKKKTERFSTNFQIELYEIIHIQKASNNYSPKSYIYNQRFNNQKLTYKYFQRQIAL